MLTLLKEMFIALDEDNVMNIAPRCLGAGFSQQEILAALNEAIEGVGDLYSAGEYTLSDLMMAGILYEQVIALPEFDISKAIEKSVTIGSIILGTIESDIHDLGKSIFKSAAVAAGFDVIDLGVDVSPELFCENVKTYKPDILAISAILTTALPYIQDTIKLLKIAGLRDNVKVIIGSSLVSPEICDAIGADAFTNNVLKGLAICRNWIV